MTDTLPDNPRKKWPNARPKKCDVCGETEAISGPVSIEFKCGKTFHFRPHGEGYVAVYRCKFAEAS